MKTFPYFIVLAVLLGCSDSNQKSDALIQANQVHLQSVRIAQALQQTLDSLHKQRPGLAENSRLDSIKQLVTMWEEAAIEVPGFVHEHQHGEGHQHKPTPQMTDESMLEYQLNARKAIESIRTQLDSHK